ncbi:MAG: ATP-binding protein [Streptococcaceae bacterium]|jgi:predicted AAA+ superfamily ATPase|nr:ATP-binding protein [Streptococcaceae bacterium]
MRIRRDEYLNKLHDFKHKDLIKVVSGVRRSGKSTLFDLFIDDLKNEGVKENQIIQLNFEDPMYRDLLSDPYELYDFLLDKMKEEIQYYIFLDEIQAVYQFEKCVNGLNIKKNVDLYLTGSNAYFLSSELATLLTGRYITIEILPLSFKEFTQANPEKSKEENYQSYSQTSFPYALSLEENQQKELYVTTIIDTILLNDVVPRINATNIVLLKRIFAFLLDSIGSEISINKIATVLSNRGEGKIYPKMVDKYLSGLLEALLMYSIPRFDLKGKQILLGNAKYYSVDVGLRKVMLGNTKEDVGHILENIVFLELKRRGYQVFVGKIQEFEIDFVCKIENRYEYFQVASSVLDPKTLERELRPFNYLNDGYARTLLTFDVIGEGANYEGVIQKNVLNWLLE